MFYDEELINNYVNILTNLIKTPEFQNLTKNNKIDKCRLAT